jgi:hypothetical protein
MAPPSTSSGRRGRVGAVAGGARAAGAVRAVAACGCLLLLLLLTHAARARDAEPKQEELSPFEGFASGDARTSPAPWAPQGSSGDAVAVAASGAAAWAPQPSWLPPQRRLRQAISSEFPEVGCVGWGRGKQSPCKLHFCPITPLEPHSAGLNDPTVLCGKAVAQRIKVTLGITG